MIISGIIRICSTWLLDIRISTCLKPIQHKLQASYVSYFSSHCTNKYAMEKEAKEKNMIIFTTLSNEFMLTAYENFAGAKFHSFII